MKKLFIVSALFIMLTSCNSNGKPANDGAADDTVSKAHLTNPAATDTTKLPSGVDNAEVISTDTNAMSVQKSIDKANASKKKK